MGSICTTHLIMDRTTKNKCPNCKRETNPVHQHKCTQCKKCSRYFVDHSKHKCLFKICEKCHMQVKITRQHYCKKYALLTCAKCSYTTYSQQDMVEHRKQGHIYNCPDCPFKSKLIRTMNRHYYSRHKLMDRGYHCPYCSLSFNDKFDYQDHVYTHVNTKMSISQSAFKIGNRHSKSASHTAPNLSHMSMHQLKSFLQISRHKSPLY